MLILKFEENITFGFLGKFNFLLNFSSLSKSSKKVDISSVKSLIRLFANLSNLFFFKFFLFHLKEKFFLDELNFFSNVTKEGNCKNLKFKNNSRKKPKYEFRIKYLLLFFKG